MRLLRLLVTLSLAAIAGCIPAEAFRFLGGGPPAGSDGPGSCADSAAPADLISTLDQRRPCWDTVRRWASETGRLPIPAFAKQLTVLPLKFGPGSTIRSHFDYWATVTSTYPGQNVSPSKMAATIAPPHGAGAAHEYPYSEPVLDEKIRAAAALLLAEKKRGFPVMFAMQVPDSPRQPFADEASFRTWIEDAYLPRVIQQAKGAEAIQAEYFAPFPKEVEVFLNQFFQPKLWSLGSSKVLELAQQWVDRTREAVRPHFKGRLVAHSYADYSDASTAFWKGLRFRGFDEIHVTVVPSCSLESTNASLDKQFAVQQEVASASGDVPWSIGELWIRGTYFKACQNDLSAIDVSIVKAVVDRLDNLPVRPRGLWVDLNPDDSGPNLSDRMLGVLTDYFKTH